MQRATLQFGVILSGLILAGVVLGPWVYERYHSVMREARVAEFEAQRRHIELLITTLGSVEAYLEYQRIIGDAERPDR